MDLRTKENNKFDGEGNVKITSISDDKSIGATKTYNITPTWARYTDSENLGFFDINPDEEQKTTILDVQGFTNLGIYLSMNKEDCEVKLVIYAISDHKDLNEYKAKGVLSQELVKSKNEFISVECRSMNYLKIGFINNNEEEVKIGCKISKAY